MRTCVFKGRFISVIRHIHELTSSMLCCKKEEPYPLDRIYEYSTSSGGVLVTYIMIETI